MATTRQEMIEEIAEDLEAERCYADMLAHSETVVDAFDLFDNIDSRHDHLCRCPRCKPQPPDPEPAFDDCNRAQHYALCGPYHPFEPCRFGSHWHYVDDGLTAYRYVGKCPNASEYGEPVEQPCIPPEDRE